MCVCACARAQLLTKVKNDMKTLMGPEHWAYKRVTHELKCASP